jgi:hypothetical protein
VAKHRIHRWLQFGILDLLIVTTVAAIFVALFRPLKSQSHRALPRLFGAWEFDGRILVLMPDRSYVVIPPFAFRNQPEIGTGWTISAHPSVEDVFALEYGKTRLLFRRSEEDTLDVVTAGGQIQQTIKAMHRLEGLKSGGVPHGIWTTRYLDPPAAERASLEYRNGELIDLCEANGARDLELLTLIRSARQLPPLARRDFADKDAKEKSHE